MIAHHWHIFKIQFFSGEFSGICALEVFCHSENCQTLSGSNPEELWTLLNPTQAGQTIKIGYKEKSGGKIKTVTLKSQYQKPILENL